MKVNTRTTTVLLAATVAALPAVAFGREAAKPLDEPVSVASLADSLKPLKDHFNAHTDKTRFVAILSPT